NNTVIKAKEGELVGSTDSDVLSLILKEGNYYDEVEPSDYKKRKRKPFTKSYFDEYVINIDLSDFNNVDLDDETYNSTHGMLKISELDESIDSFSVSYNTRMADFRKTMYNRSGVPNLNINYKPKDTVVEEDQNLLAYFDTYDGAQISNLALGTVNSALAHLSMKKQEFKVSIVQINKFEIALHEKYALSIACIVLFFVGAPLGAIIRKGGMGLPIVVAILLFLTYHFIGIFAKNSAENGSVSPFVATWLSTWIMLPLGVYLTYRATTDQGLFVFDNFIAPVRKLFKKAGLFKDKSKSE
ncbi:MAG: LptF/LptG family permease, partial [Gramella sp.]|nr:LptF/LptG family permease [Christiangramia sp.]